MNIFALSNDPRRAAIYHCDEHVLKMILECCQMLYTCHWVLESSHLESWEETVGVKPYKKTHENHPCCIWIRKAKEN